VAGMSALDTHAVNPYMEEPTDPCERMKRLDEQATNQSDGHGIAVEHQPCSEEGLHGAQSRDDLCTEWSVHGKILCME
jgi:hypothetical protein